MKSKAPLALMEQLVMVGVFALAAALCLQVFVLSDRTSRRYTARDGAVTAAQNAAELLKSCRGDYEAAAEALDGVWNGQMLGVHYDADWGDDGPDAYYLLVTPADSGQRLLGAADVTVYTADGDHLVTLPVGWQEVEGDA